MVAARTPRQLAGFSYEAIINCIDWNRVLIQAHAEHLKHSVVNDTCGECIQKVLLRTDE